MEYKYLILGGGMAADRAVQGIRSQDATSQIGIITREPYPCYERPPLSKGLWTGAPEDSIWRHTENERVTFHMEEEVTALDPIKHTVTTNKSTYTYEKLLIATGVSPRKLPCPDTGVIYYHDLKDYRKVRELYAQGEHFVVIGSGYIGSEMAAALAMNGKKVTMIFPGPAIYHRKLPIKFATFLNAYFTERGVQLKPGQTVNSVDQDGSLFHVTTSSGERITADGVIAGIGCEPNLSFAHSLEQDNGLISNAKLQTSHPDIYAAGDIVNFHYPLVDTRLRIEHEDAANTMGFCAGQNMAGLAENYTHQPYFYSEMFELGYEAVGLLGQNFEIVEHWDDLYRAGIIYFCKEGVIKGAMSWGIWGQMDRIRHLISSSARADSLTPLPQ
ncbi:MAG: NAD(P)/FAD-dependent oxidoreductase [Chlamydiales bacterium]|nr:NAD(P)/FAD-dependent oxidoreductase [Chlamydiales bacterium]